MGTAREVRVEQVKATLVDLRLVSRSTRWLSVSVILAIFASYLFANIPTVPIPQSDPVIKMHVLALLIAIILASVSVATALIVIIERPKLFTRYCAYKLLVQINSSGANNVIVLARALRIVGYDGLTFVRCPTYDTIKTIKRLIERCPAKEFATFLCSVVYLGCKAHVPDKSLESEVLIEAEKFLLPPKDGNAKGLIELIINQCRESSCISPRLYMSRFIDGLAVSRHEGIAMMMLDAIDLALSKSAAARAHEYTEKLAKKHSVQQEQWQKRQEKCFVKTVRLITKS